MAASLRQLSPPPPLLVDSFDLAAMGSAPASPRPSVIGPNQPPPLQRVLPSKVAPANPGGGLPRQQSIPPIFTRQGSQGSVLPRLSLVSLQQRREGRRGGEGEGRRRGGKEEHGLHRWGSLLLPPPPQPSPPNAARFTLQSTSRPDPVTEDQQEEVAEGEEEERER